MRRLALDRRNAFLLINTTVILAGKAGVGDIIDRIVSKLKDDSEPFRLMTMETVDKLLAKHGSAEIDTRLEEQLVDGMLYALGQQGEGERKQLRSSLPLPRSSSRLASR